MRRAKNVGLIVLTCAVKVFRGDAVSLAPAVWIGLAYVLFGSVAFVMEGMDPHFIGFIVIGLLLGVFGRPVRG